MTDRQHLHTFLAYVHEAVRPHVYAEIGVQHGTSLNLAHAAGRAFGIDPDPLVQQNGNQWIYRMKSDDFFEHEHAIVSVDFGFIDGLHHYEQALRDFLNLERYCHNKSIIIFDDVLPRNQEEAARTQCPGDWTGDVWKVYGILKECRPDLTLTLIDTDPTGTLLVTGFGKPQLGGHRSKRLHRVVTTPGTDLQPVPMEILTRAQAVSPFAAINFLKGMFSDPVLQ